MQAIQLNTPETINYTEMDGTQKSITVTHYVLNTVHLNYLSRVADIIVAKGVIENGQFISKWSDILQISDTDFDDLETNGFTEVNILNKIITIKNIVGTVVVI